MPRISAEEPVSHLRSIPIHDNGEPLVDFLQNCPALLLDRPRFDYRRETLVREGVADRLCQAAHALPNGYRIAIVEGWRAPIIQKRMYAAVWQSFKQRHPLWPAGRLKRTVDRFSAPMDLEVPPPHTTGAAIDVFLVDDAGNPYDLQSPYETHDHRGFPLAARGLSEEARKNREILSSVLINAGLTNYPSEFWHYSYGDQGWAYRGGHSAALYAAITPENWEPDPKDLTEDPLVFIQEPNSR